MLRFGKDFLKFVTHESSKQFCNLKWIEISRFRSTFSRTDITIPIPISGGHLAGAGFILTLYNIAQLWQGAQASNKPSRTPVICLHGWRDNSGSFDPLIPLIITDGMTMVSVDFPGHGFSSHTTSAGYDALYDGVTSIYRIMEHFKWDKISLIGHSYGSVMSFLYTFTNPSQVEKYVAIEFMHVLQVDILSLYQRTFKTLFKVEKLLKISNLQQPSLSFEDMMKIERKERLGTVSDQGIKTLLKRGALPDPDNPKMFRFTTDLRTTIPLQYSRISFEESLKLAKNIKCPVCVIKGEPGFDFEPREKLMKTAEAISEANNGNLEFHTIPGTHHLHLNEPENVAPIISKFLEK